MISLQESDGRFLGRRCDQSPFLKGEHYRAGRAQVQVLGIEILPVGWSIAIHHMQVFKVQKHYSIAEDPTRGIIRSIGSLRVDTFWTTHHAAASPSAGRPSGTGEKFNGTLRKIFQIQRREVRLGVAAAPGNRGINHSIDKIETPVTREGSREISRRHTILT